MRRPTATVAMANMRTAPAATSLAFPIIGLMEVVILSASSSIAVLKASAINTPPIDIAMTDHSRIDNWNQIPARITVMAIEE